MGAGLLQRRRHAHDGGEVFRPGPPAPLLGPALNEVRQGHAPAGVQGADALGPVELVGGEGEKVNVLRPHVDGQVPRRLDRVGVEQHPRLPADCADLRDGLDGADLVVGVHDAYQAGVGPDGRPDLLRRHQAVFVDVQQGDGKAFALQPFQGVEHRVVLEGGGDDVALALPGPQGGGGTNGLVVRLAAAGGEGELPCLAAKTGGDSPPGVLQGLPGPLAEGVEAGGVAVDLVHIGQHSVHSGPAHLRCGRVIGIDFHRESSVLIT